MKVSCSKLICVVTVLCSLLFVSRGVNSITQTIPETNPQKEEALVLTVTVTNSNGEFVTGLRQSNFSILEDKQPKTIVSFDDQDIPVSIGILLDTSGSMGFSYNPEKIKLLRKALERFLELSNKSDEYFVIGFNKQPQLLFDWNPVTARTARPVPLQLSGNTALFDACYLGVEKVMRGRHAKRAIILISDGENNESHYTLGELRDLLKQSNVLVYSVDLFGSDPNRAGSSLGMEGETILDDLSKMSGAMAFHRKGAWLHPKQVMGVFELIADELRHQYSIGVIPTSSGGKNRWHRINAKVIFPTDAPRGLKHLSVRTREGYYSVN